MNRPELRAVLDPVHKNFKIFESPNIYKHPITPCPDKSDNNAHRGREGYRTHEQYHNIAHTGDKSSKPLGYKGLRLARS